MIIGEIRKVKKCCGQREENFELFQQLQDKLHSKI